jgi:hypothetical protein
MTPLSELYELLIIGVILIGIFLAWRAGQANPEGTGKVGKRLSALESRVQLTEDKLRGVATKADIVRLEGEVDALREQVKGDRELAERTFKSVERIESFLIEQALGARK